jgi:phosphate starvation-inducible protein PhoH
MVERDVQAILTELVRRENESSRRLRALEERSSLTEMRASTLQDSFLKISEEKRVFNDKINERLTSIENSILRIDNDLIKINKNLEKMAKKTELKEIENMLSFFNPIKTNFVTKEDVERMLGDKEKDVDE